MSSQVKGQGEPLFSVVMPCYNEEDMIGFTIPLLIEAFQNAELSMELIAIDNGSSDRTWEILEELASANPCVVPVKLETNASWGGGLLAGHGAVQGDWVMHAPADLQVEVESIIRLAQLARVSAPLTLFKIRRRFRLESTTRRLVSVGFNLLTQVFFGSLGTMDLNGNPKIIHRDFLQRMNLASTDWFLDVEVMIKAKALEMGMVELNAFSQIRVAGKSNVNATTSWEFVKNLASHRWGSKQSLLRVLPSEPSGDGSAARRIEAV